MSEDELEFANPFACQILGGFYQWLLRSPALRNYVINQSEKSIKGLYGEQICRTRYIDETVIAALDAGFRQVVILGAGLDTRALRLPGIDQAQVFELDMPRVQQAKVKRVAKLLHGVPAYLHFVPADLEEQELNAVLQSGGFDPRQKALFVWEAVTQYLPAEAVAKTLRYIGSCAPGSRVVFTYVPRWIIEHPERDPEAQAMIKMGKMKLAPFIFGLEPQELPAYLGGFGLRQVVDVDAGYYQENWLKPMGRVMDVTLGEHICLAEVGS